MISIIVRLCKENHVPWLHSMGKTFERCKFWKYNDHRFRLIYYYVSNKKWSNNYAYSCLFVCARVKEIIWPSYFVIFNQWVSIFSTKSSAIRWATLPDSYPGQWGWDLRYHHVQTFNFLPQSPKHRWLTRLV